MAVELATAYVSLVPSARNITGALTRELSGPTSAIASSAGSKAGKSFGSKFGGALRNMTKTAGLGLAIGGLAGVVLGIKGAIAAAEESIKIAKDTEAVIKSTGGAANVTAKDIGNLADAISKKTGIDDETIQSGSNVLLTFTKIRNEVGAGNDIFDQATRLAVDLSARLGTDLTSANLQLGKALNDPIKGMTALSRAGIQFTAEQKEQITALVESGDLLGAQKIILGELAVQVEGSAEAQATATDKLEVAFGNLAEEIGTALLPAVDAFSTWMIDKGIPKIREIAAWVRDELLPALGDIKVWIEENVIPPLQSMWTIFHEDILPVLTDVAAFINDTLIPAFGNLVGALKGSNDEAANSGPSWAGWTAAVGAVAVGVAFVVSKVGFLVPFFKGIGLAIGAVGQAIMTAILFIISPAGVMLAAFIAIGVAIGQHWDTIQNFFVDGGVFIVQKWRGMWDFILGTLNQWWQNAQSWLSTAWAGITGFFARLWEWVTTKWSEMWAQLSEDVKRWWAGASAFFADVWASITGTFQAGLDWLTDAWDTAWNTVKRIVTDAANAIVSTITGWRDRLIGIFSNAITWLLQAGRDVLSGLWNGIQAIWNATIAPWFRFLSATVMGFLVGSLQWLVEGGKNIIRGLWTGIKVIWSDIVNWFKDVPGKIKSILGIASPPKWAIEAGRFIMKGLMKGLGWGAGKVMDYMGRIAGNFTGALKGAWDSAFAAAKDFLFGGDGGTGFVGLQEPFASRLQALINVSGGQISIGSGRRSRAEQARLYARWVAGVPGQARAAPPGRSRHEVGLAADLVGNLPLAHRLARIFGLRFPVRGESWHIELGPGHTYFEKGSWNVPRGGGFTHPGEMVLPARLAGAVRSALAGGGAGGSGTYVAPGAVVIGMPPGATLAEAERLGGAAGRSFLEVLARRRVVTDARIA